MHHVIKLHHVIVFALFTFLTGAPAEAQSEQGDGGRFDAYACEKLPSPLQIDVQVLDDTQQNLRLRDKFTAQLNKDGIKTATGSPFVLTLDIKTLREFIGQDRRALGKVRIGKGGGVSLRGKLWSNNDDSVLGGRKRTASHLAIDQLLVTANLNRHDNGRCVWQGEILYDLHGTDPDYVAARIMSYLAGAIGQSAQKKSVSLFK